MYNKLAFIFTVFLYHSIICAVLSLVKFVHSYQFGEVLSRVSETTYHSTYTRSWIFPLAVPRLLKTHLSTRWRPVCLVTQHFVRSWKLIYFGNL